MSTAAATVLPRTAFQKRKVAALTRRAKIVDCPKVALDAFIKLHEDVGYLAVMHTWNGNSVMAQQGELALGHDGLHLTHLRDGGGKIPVTTIWKFDQNFDIQVLSRWIDGVLETK